MTAWGFRWVKAWYELGAAVLAAANDAGDVVLCDYCSRPIDEHRKPGLLDTRGRPLFVPCRGFIEAGRARRATV